MFELTGKRALVTGASGGIGSAIAQTLAAQGAEVVLSGTRVERLETVAAQISSETDAKTHILPCDLADTAAVDKLVPDAVAAMGGIDILVNNAGMTRDNVFMRLKDEDWDKIVAVNLTAAFHLMRAVLRPMMKQRYGRIIGISSVVGVVGNAGQANYAATKAGLIGMSKSLAHEVASRNITVNTISPGFISSAMTDELNEKQRDNFFDKIPMARFGTSEEVAASAAFLASEESSYITGHNLMVNGGVAMI